MQYLDFVVILVLFQIKHFVADYPLQGSYMLGKFKEVSWEMPLLAHASVHMALTFLIVLMYLPFKLAALMAIADLLIHFVIDRTKVVLSRGYDKDKDPEFWWYLGADQMAHHFTHYTIAIATVIIMETL